MKTQAIIMAGGKGTRLKVLTRKRAKPAVPFAGKYRIIDFPLSNCVNSGIFDVLVLTQYRPHSLNDHISKGRPWDLDRSFTGGVRMLQPFTGRKASDFYVGTADAVYQNLNFIRKGNPDYVLILSGDHVYQMDYAKLIRYHEEKGADATICTIDVPLEEASRFGILNTDDDNRVKEFLEKPDNPPDTLASMGVYLFNLDVLDEMLRVDANQEDSDHDFGHNIIPRMIDADYDMYAYPFNGYWVDVGTVASYWSTHMDLVAHPPALDLNDRSWVIHTRSEERPPVRIEEGATVKDSLITDGSIVAEGALVERSVLSPGVYVGPGAVVRESVILTDTFIESGAVVERSVIDKNCVIGEDAHIGSADASPEDGIVMVGKNTQLPSGFRVGDGAVVGSDLRPEDFTTGLIEAHVEVASKDREDY